MALGYELEVESNNLDRYNGLIVKSEKSRNQG